MSCAALEVCKRQRGPMHILALRRCTPAAVTIRWRGNVLRLRRAVGRGAGAAWAVEGSDPRGHRCPVRARGRARLHTLVPAPVWGRSPRIIPAGRRPETGGARSRIIWRSPPTALSPPTAPAPVLVCTVPSGGWTVRLARSILQRHSNGAESWWEGAGNPPLPSAGASLPPNGGRETHCLQGAAL